MPDITISIAEYDLEVLRRAEQRNGRVVEDMIADSIQSGVGRLRYFERAERDRAHDMAPIKVGVYEAVHRWEGADRCYADGRLVLRLDEGSPEHLPEAITTHARGFAAGQRMATDELDQHVRRAVAFQSAKSGVLLLATGVVAAAVSVATVGVAGGGLVALTATAMMAMVGAAMLVVAVQRMRRPDQPSRVVPPPEVVTPWWTVFFEDAEGRHYNEHVRAEDAQQAGRQILLNPAAHLPVIQAVHQGRYRRTAPLEC